MSNLNFTIENVKAIKTLLKDAITSFESNLPNDNKYKLFSSLELNNYLENELGYDFSSNYSHLNTTELKIYSQLVVYRMNLINKVFKNYCYFSTWNKNNYVRFYYKFND